MNNFEEGLVATFSSVTLHGKKTHNNLSSDDMNGNTSKRSKIVLEEQ